MENVKEVDEILKEIKDMATVPLAVLDAERAWNEKRHRRLIYVILALIASILIMNLAWLYAWTQYDYIGYEATTDKGGMAAIIGNDGDIINGNGSNEEED